MYHKIKPIIGKGTLDFPNNWGRVKHRLGFGSFNIHLRTSLKALIDTDLIYHAVLLGIIVSVLFVETIVANALFSAIYTIFKCKAEQKPRNPYEPTTFSLSSVFLFQLSDLLCWCNLHLTLDHECSEFVDCPLTSNNLPDHWKCQAGGPPVLSYREWWHGIILNKCCLFLN